MKMPASRTKHRVTLRAAGPEDREFLLKVYAATRQEEISIWGWDLAQQRAFIEMQFAARERSYQAAYPGAEQQVIADGKSSVGAMIVARGAAEIRLVDIALLPEIRNAGVGTALLRELIAEAAAAGIPLRLSVARGNRAAKLYERLGFVAVGQDQMYCEMELRPA